MLLQVLSFVVLTAIVIFSWVDYKRTVLIWLPAQLLFNAQVSVKYSPPAMSLQMAVNLYLLLFYFIKYQNLSFRQNTNQKLFPLWKATILIMSSYILSSIFSPIGTFRGLNVAIKYFVTDIGIVFLAYKMLKTKEDVGIFIKSSVVVFAIIISLGISEFILHDNLWADFVYYNSPQDDTTYGRMFYIPPSMGGYSLRYGQIRALSTFGIHIAFGVASLVYFWLFLLMALRKFCYVPIKLTWIMAVATLTGVFLCNSKTGLVGLVFILLGLYSKKNINVKLIISVMMVLIIMLLCFPEYINNFESLFDSKLAEEGGGSTVAGRERQFEIALNMFYMNPLFGNGVGAIDVLKKIGYNSGILGAESVWMQILPERGLLGIVAYCYLYIAYYQGFIKFIPKKNLCFFLLAILVMSTATGDITQSYWGITLVAAGRMFELNREPRKIINYYTKIRQ